MIHVYLDDYRACPEGFVAALNVMECIELLNSCEVDILSLDYDLGWGQPNGFEVVRHMVERKVFAKRIYLHTSSPSGRMHMYQMLYQHKPENVQLVNGPMPEALLEQVRRAR